MSTEHPQNERTDGTAAKRTPSPFLLAPLVGLLLALTASSDETARIGLLGGRVLAQIGAALLVLLLLPATSERARRFALPGAFLLVAGILGEGGTRLLARSLSFADGPVAIALLLAAGSAALSLRDPLRFPRLTAVLGVLGLGFLTASGGPSLPDTASVVTGAAASLLPVLGLVLLLRRTLVRTPLRPAEFAVFGSLGAVGLFGLARSVALYRIEELDTALTGRATLAVVLAAAVGLLLSVLPGGFLRSSRGSLLVSAPLVVALLASATPSLLALERNAEEGLAKAQDAVEADLRLVQGMTEEVGAGPRPEFRGKTFVECDKLNSRDCFITHYDDIALRYGVAAAVADVVQKVKDNKGSTFPAHCHQVVHNLGQMAYQLASEFGDAADLDPQVCGTGYTHGLWEQQFEIIGTDVMFARTGTLCTELNMVSDWYKWTCHHILGHMMSAKLANDPTRASEYCTKVEDPQGLTDCLTGGWMNFFQDDVVIARMRADGDLENLFGVCYGAPEATKFFCYQELFPVIYSMINGDDFAAGQACLDLSEPSRGEGFPWTVNAQNYTDRCIQGLARGIGASSNQNYLLMRERCLSMPEKAHDPCLTAAAASYVLNTGGAKTAFEICKFVGDQAYREYCYFWTKHARALLANGPNSENLPGENEVRMPEQTEYAPVPGFVFNRTPDSTVPGDEAPVDGSSGSDPLPPADR
jgi:hypothetical protein